MTNRRPRCCDLSPVGHNQAGVMASSVNMTSPDRSTSMQTRAKRGNNNVGKMDVRVTSCVTVAPPAQLADRRKSQELEICKMRLEWQKDKIDELTKERDYLKEQLAASLSKEPTSSVQDSSEVLSISSPSSDGSVDESSDSSMSTTSSDEDRKKRKKGKAKKHKSKKHDKKQRTRVQNPKQVVTRYNKILRLFRRGGTMSAAFKRLGVDRNTIVATAPIAELFIVAPERYKELEKNKQGQKLSLFATQCAAAISADPETEEKFKAYKSSGKLLPLKTKKD
ncbi:coiled-coil domain-containing protein 106 [Oreochromis niloticus]|uniref:coiled-coil domain-containing protein 106 n=1 Tax=Oreochromis niloticus TaxID=8128 RepID=UPI000DF4B68A|nr:coiled-coil domain-containing protein 106-like [Oreochromis niloticus]